ncbi:SLC13 family permease [Psychroflexus planctonicus]|uniref:Membrane protein n=1 Tax=Psychroflexus planctonicus TaxID=1526575 RepID=A0ABQ1SGQ6_9FLAO|nr:SLC13 family permease [Psychroflexus planctonicus]GGE30215.1 membrane protein [Psychroflexus planctonicus]
MATAAIITLVIIGVAVFLFATDLLPIDLVAILIMLALILTGSISAEEGVAGFSNKATITVVFMFVLSEALLKTGALQVLAQRLSKLFKRNFNLGLLLMMLLIAFISAFINNTPVVAVFIPVVIQIAHRAGLSPAKMLIPLSFASIFGGMCTLIGTSTNILVSGIAEKEGEAAIDLFAMTKMGVILLVIGILYMILFGRKLLPNRANQNLKQKFNLRSYVTEIELLSDSSSVNTAIMDSELVKDLELDVMEVRRSTNQYVQPAGDFILKAGDILKVRCNVDKIKSLKDQAKILVSTPIKIGDDDLKGTQSTLVEMVISAESELHNKTLKELDFRRRFRAIPLAIQHRESISNDGIYDVRLRSGDIILAEVKTHYVKELKRIESDQKAPFVLLSEDMITDFDKPKFIKVLSLILVMVGLAAFNILDIMVGVISCVVALVLLKVLDMKEMYQAVNWKIIFLLAGTLSLGTAMVNTGLDLYIAYFITNQLGGFGPVAVISGLYLTTSLLTEIMSNNASAALMAPIAIATAHGMEMETLPFLITIMFAASATFMTPVGYQTNAMVFSAGKYTFRDFFKVGVGLNLLFWVAASILIPLLYF